MRKLNYCFGVRLYTYAEVIEFVREYPEKVCVWRTEERSSRSFSGFFGGFPKRPVVGAAAAGAPKISAAAAGGAKICSNFCERSLPIAKSRVLEQYAPPLRGLRPQRLPIAAKRKLFLLTP